MNQITPLLNSYAIHIQNAQNFMKTDGQVFGNDIELLGYLDNRAVYAETLANQINTAVNIHNAQQTSNSDMIDEDELVEILKILRWLFR